MRVSTSFGSKPRAVSKKSQFAEVPMGTIMFMTLGTDYRANESTGESTIPKEGSVRSSLSGYAKKVGKKVCIRLGTDGETGCKGLGFAFYDSKTPNPFIKTAEPTEAAVNDSGTNTGEVVPPTENSQPA